ncbi:nmt-1 [Pristionchus pacificus]|uniref:Glycylpeptide N-tetradecanoyltransferase n=1 Tax=Pristionchus pacificus TaxID=54126 RepID=A0A8R1Z2U7_PRIPA|nr:nmt-1 [Pristionchus pacificus]
MPKKQDKKAEAPAGNSENATDAGSSQQELKMSEMQLAEQLRLAAELEKLSLMQGTAGPIRDMGIAKQKTYAFWSTQPVPQLGEDVDANEPIEADIPIAKLRQEPYSLPDAFEWSDIDMTDEKELQEVYTLLCENYVEDDDNMFRFDYSKQFLQWALLIPGWLKTWHCGVRAKSNKKLFAFISAVPQTIRVYDKEKKMVEINFLCVHKKLRSKRVAPVLIREITRRVNLQGIFQAAYTAGVILPKPVAVCRYYHRTLNPKKLIECRFSHLGPKMTMARTVKLYKLPDVPATEGLRPLQKKDLTGAWQLLQQHLKQFKLAPIFSKKEFEHIFLPREDVVYSFVVEKAGKITDMVSFYCLPSTVVNHPVHNQIRAAYGYYCVPGSVPLKQLVNDMLINAHQLGFDVFNALDLMDNKEILDDLKFGVGDGNLQYYLYNWRCPEMQPNDVGLILQ